MKGETRPIATADTITGVNRKKKKGSGGPRENRAGGPDKGKVLKNGYYTGEPEPKGRRT